LVPTWAEPVRPTWPLAFAGFLFLCFQVDNANGNAGGAPRLASLAFDGLREFNNPSLPAAIAAEALDALPATFAGASPADSAPATDAPMHLIGSNGWAVAPSRTSVPGTGYHLGDPHMPWIGPWRLWEVHMRSADVEVAGASFFGLPMPIFGRNAHVAWTFTMNGPDGGDAYRLTLDPEDATRYLYDGESRAFEVEEATFAAADADPITLPLRWSVHGPVTYVNAAEGYAIAYRMTNYHQPWTAEQFLRMALAQNLDEFETAMAMLQLGRFHVVAADTSGSILYAWNARVPRRPAGFDFRHPVDGSVSESLWDAADPVAWEELPRLRDPAVGFVQNCNNEPWVTTSTAEDPSKEDFANPVFPGHGDSERAWRVRRAFLGERPFGREEALALGAEGHMIGAETFLPLIATAFARHGADHPDATRLAQAVHVLAGWDGVAEARQTAPAVFMLFMFEFFGTVFPPTAPLDWTEADLDEGRAVAMLDALGRGLDILEGAVGTWRVMWGMMHGIRLGNVWYPVSTGQYPAVSLMNCNADPLNDPEMKCFIGSSHVIVNELSATIKSWSIMPLGQTRDATKPYYRAMTPLFARRELKPLAFADDELRERTFAERVFDAVAE
jgi:acyl-homoserine-lactone acylase